MREAYSHEVISHGFWPGSGPMLEPAFYAYAVPEPPGLEGGAVSSRRPRTITANWASSSCRTRRCARAADPDAAIRAFIDSTYDRAATLGGWDRAALERPVSAARPVNRPT